MQPIIITTQNIADILASLSSFDLTNVSQSTLSSIFNDLRNAVVAYQNDSPTNIITAAQQIVATQALKANPPATQTPAI